MVEACFSNNAYYYDENAKSAGCAGGTVPSGPSIEIGTLHVPLCEGESEYIERIDESTFKYVGFYDYQPDWQSIQSDGRNALIRWWSSNSDEAVRCRLLNSGSDDIEPAIIIQLVPVIDFGYDWCERYSESIDGYDLVYFGWATFDVSFAIVECDERMYPFI